MIEHVCAPGQAASVVSHTPVVASKNKPTKSHNTVSTMFFVIIVRSLPVSIGIAVRAPYVSVTITQNHGIIVAVNRKHGTDTLAQFHRYIVKDH